MPIAGENLIRVEEFFAYARERQEILERRRAGKPAPWTTDPILRAYPFCNVFREDDRVTVWFRENVRDKYRDGPEALLATVVFRWFTRIETGEAIFCQPVLGDNCTPFELLLAAKNKRQTSTALSAMKRAIVAFCGRGPYVTGAYIISAPPGMSKLDGIIENIRNFRSFPFEFNGERYDWHELAHLMKGNSWTLEKAHDALREVPYLGPFHAYEVVTDLRHTSLLEKAEDVNSWCSVGPGARRGLNRVMGRPHGDKLERDLLTRRMQRVLNLAWSNRFFWPRRWPRWEMRELEHTLCEFDKYERAREGDTHKMKRRFRHGG